jgi:hypothetical protein
MLLRYGPYQNVVGPTDLEFQFSPSPVAHWYGWLIGSPTRVVLVVCVKTFCASFGNLASSATLWSEYLSFPTWPSSSGPTCTLASMHGRTIYAASFLLGDLGIYILSFSCSGG